MTRYIICFKCGEKGMASMNLEWPEGRYFIHHDDRVCYAGKKDIGTQYDIAKCISENAYSGNLRAEHLRRVYAFIEKHRSLQKINAE
jgi:hypothetical protein